MFQTVESFYRPESVPEALQLLHLGNGQARLVAGGTDLAVQPGETITILIDITRAGLNYIRSAPGGVSIGATTTLAELEHSPLVRDLAGGILSHAAASCGSMQIRNVATIAGNMVNGSPAADLAAPLLILDAEVIIADSNSRKAVPIAQYLSMPHLERTGKLVLEIAIPNRPAGARCGWSFQKLGRTTVDISLVNAAAGLHLDAQGRIEFARLALAAVAPVPMRIAEAEASLIGQIAGRKLFEKIGAQVMEVVSPITDQRASAEYRREMSRVLTVRALCACAEKAGLSL